MPLPHHTISNVFVLAGLSGSGKTAVIDHLINTGNQALNIESLCRHDGSVFASLQYPSQPSAYQFHKQLNKVWSSFDFNNPVFIERELSKLGRIHLPGWLNHQMNTAPVIWLNTSYHLRVKRIAIFIQNTSPTHFYNCLTKLEKKLGHQNFELAVQYLQQGNTEKLATVLLEYYDHVPGYSYPESRILCEVNIMDTYIEAAAKRILVAAASLKDNKAVLEQ